MNDEQQVMTGNLARFIYEDSVISESWISFKIPVGEIVTIDDIVYQIVGSEVVVKKSNSSHFSKTIIEYWLN